VSDKGWWGSRPESEGHASREKGLSEESAPAAGSEQAPPAEPASAEGWFGDAPSGGHASRDKGITGTGAPEVEPAAAAAPAEPEPPAPPPVQTYTVVSGDTLWAISERFYGDGNQYQRIADASGVSNPDLIYPGQVLTIP
jgi:nucleoid-associated protein YgaU